VALGFFDGFHRGHQAILESARHLDFAPVVFTFRNHPATVVAAERAPALITNFEERTELLSQAGCDVVWVDFDRPFSLIEPHLFIHDLLVTRLAARQVVTGQNYRFGHRASGHAHTLRDSGCFEVVTVDPVVDGDQLISSTRIRTLLLEGRVGDADRLLGRPFRLSASVQRGDQLGRDLGVPTANLALTPDKVWPRFGIYAVQVQHRERRLPGVASLGVRPTVKDKAVPLLEVHLLDFAGDLYGEQLQVDFIHWMRAEQKFPGLQELKHQMGLDLALARQLLA
jgi:riboflavin kinase/FMN adenylyltransferase